MKRTVITYGTFDLLHTGHVRLLERARSLGDRLIVGLSTDEFNAIKGKISVQTYADRKAVLEAIQFVDLVIPETAWNQKEKDIIQYGVDLFVMGDDWKGKFDFLKDSCEVLYLPRTAGISTSDLKKRIDKQL